MFLITAFCFFHSSFILSAPYDDLLSCNRFSIRAFSISMFQSCFLRKDPCRDLLLLSLQLTVCARLFIVLVIFSSSSLFSLYIYVHLSSRIIFFLPLLRARGWSQKARSVEFGLMFLILSRWPSICLQSYFFLRTFFPQFTPPIINLFIAEAHYHEFAVG